MRVELRRGGYLESVHQVEAAVVGSDGVAWATAGAAGCVTFMRSAAKPFQAIGLITSGAADHFHFADEELALAAASHYGEPVHTRVVSGMLEKIHLSKDALRCGAHAPYDKQAAAALVGPPSALHSNCSGKHAAMLAQCVQAGWDLEYLPIDHPLQQRNLDTVAAFSGVLPSSIELGVDGCGVPTFRLPLTAIAQAFLSLVHPAGQDGGMAEAAGRICHAMTSHPRLVGGSGVFGSDLMAAGHGQIVAKGGAEGLLGIGVRDRQLGIALKVVDGSARALDVAAMAVLDQFHLLDAQASQRLASHRQPPVTNVAGRVVGELVAVLP